MSDYSFVDVMNARTRMCDVSPCGECALNQYENSEMERGCDKFIKLEPQQAEKIIMQWAKEHPVKTNADKFKEVFGIEIEDNCHNCSGLKCDKGMCGSSIYCKNCSNYNFWIKEYKEPIRDEE